jgi:hypothetical protein
MKRGARFLVLDQADQRNKDADWIEIDVAPAQLGPLIAQLEQYRRVSDMAPERRGFKRGGEVWTVRLLVEASHPKVVGKRPGEVEYPPSLLKDSIPRAGRS